MRQKTVMMTLVWLSFTVILILFGCGQAVFGLRRYEKPSCEFVSPNYTLEWAFEPLSRSVVFVLRAELQDVGDSLWTGVGFGDRNNDSIIDFIGVFVKDNGAQTGITDTHINTTTGQFSPDSNTNVQTISIAVSNAAESTGTQVTAKFARAINSKDTQEDVDLSGCIMFNVPLQPMASVDHSEQQDNYLKSFKQFKVCHIQRYCTVDIRELKLKGETKVIKTSATSVSKEYREQNTTFKDEPLPSKPHLQASSSVEVAHSVDISGKGDPCSFTGPTYTINWSYNKASDCVDFFMKHTVKKGKWWSTVGIGDNMSDMDIAVLFLEDGKVKKMTDYYSSSYGPPEEDEDQNWVLNTSKSKIISGKIGDNEDLVELHFSRVINSPDTQKDRSMDGCVLFQFGANSGKYAVTGTNYAIRKHDEWPDLYKACDLKKRCSAPADRHHQAKRGGDVVVGQSVDESQGQITAASENSTALLPIGWEGNSTVEAGSVEADSVVALLTQEITTTTADSNAAVSQENNQHQPTADVIGSIETNLFPNSTDDTDLLLISSNSNTSSPLQQPLASDTINNNQQISNASIVPQTSLSSEQSPETPSTVSNQTQDDSEVQPALVSLFGEFSTTELFSAVSETTSRPVPSANASVWSFLHLSTVDSGVNESNSTTTTTTSSPSSTTTIEATSSSEVLSDWTTSLPASVEDDKNATASQSTSSTTSAATRTSQETSPITTTTTNTPSSSSTTSPTTTSVNPDNSEPSSSQRLKTEGECEVLKPDLEVCKGYMTTYFGQVQIWADKHNEPMEKQFGKACKLLSAVPHVPTLCCQTFKNKCSSHL